MYNTRGQTSVKPSISARFVAFKPEHFASASACPDELYTEPQRHSVTELYLRRFGRIEDAQAHGPSTVSTDTCSRAFICERIVR